MTKSFDASLPTDMDWIRFEIGDTDVTRAYLQDESITAKLAECDTKQEAALSCMYFIRGQLSRPDFRVGEVQIQDQAAAAEQYQKFIDEKEKEYGLSYSFEYDTGEPLRSDGYYSEDDE